MIKEIWKGLMYQGNDYSERLEISNLGELRNTKTKHIYRLHINKEGYCQVCISLGSRNNKKIFKIHRCVAESFLNIEYDKDMIVNHKDLNKLNNNIENLEFCSYSENSHHYFNLTKPVLISNHRKITKEEVIFIKENYIPRHKEFGARALGRKFNINKNSILDIINNNTYNKF